MRILIQICKSASVTIDGNVVSEIDKGEVLFISFKRGDDTKIVDNMIDKLLKCRIFEDENGKTNLSIRDVDGELLAVSQFTLYASLATGNRPSFTNVMSKEESKPLYDYFANELKEKYPKTKFGVFHADMKVSLINDGPFTIWLDSEEIFNG